MGAKSSKEKGLALSPSASPPPTTPSKSRPNTATDTAPKDEALSTTPEPPPNGGYGWVCTGAVAFVNAHTWGVNSSYGVFLNHYLSAHVFPNATPLEFAFVGGLSIGCALGISPFATIVIRKKGTKFTLLLGAVLQAAALISASWAKEIWELFLSQGVLFGLGMGFLFVASAPIVPQWFTTKRSLANGIATAGAGSGGLTYSLATGAMIRTIGLAWAFRVLGIVSFCVNATCAMLLKDRYKIIGGQQLAFDVTLFKRVEYLLVLAYGWFSMFAYVVLLFSIANYASSVGLTSAQASLVSALLNLGQAAGRPAIGYFSDSVGRINMAVVSAGLSGIFALLIWTFSKSFGLLVFYALVGGAFAGSYWTVIVPVTVEVVGLRDSASALSINWFAIMPAVIVSEPIALEIVARDNGKYIGAQIFVGIMYLAAGVASFLLRGWKIGEVRTLAAEKGVEPSNINPLVIDAEPELVRTVSRKEGRRRMIKDMYRWQKV